jgi:hypothetical protein
VLRDLHFGAKDIPFHNDLKFGGAICVLLMISMCRAARAWRGEILIKAFRIL